MLPGVFLLLARSAAAGPCTLAPLVVAEPLGSDPIEEPCLLVDLDLAGRAFASTFGDPRRGIGLNRAREELGLRLPGDVLTRVAFTETRTGGDGVGINGEAWVFQLQLAEARWDWRRAGVTVVAGLVDQPWTMTVQGPWQRREIAAPMVTDRGWMPRTDMGGWIGWSAPDNTFSFTGAVLTGEGANLSDPNTDFNLSGTAHVRPLAGQDAPAQVEIALYGQQGTRGDNEARDHRAAAAVIVRHDLVVGAVEGLLGWGLGGDESVLPGGTSVWARTGAGLPAVGWARLDYGRDRRDDPTNSATTWMLGGGPRLPITPDGAAPAYFVIGYEGRRYGGNASPVPGDDPVSSSETVFLQFGARIRGALAFSPR